MKNRLTSSVPLRNKCLRRMPLLNRPLLSGWVYYHISNAMQHSNTALETTAFVMYDSNTFFLHSVTFSYGSANFINILSIS